MTAIVTQGDAAHLHLPDASVDLVVTSPPYFGQRSYQDGGEHYEGQLGAEATPTEYLDALIACTAEWMRVLRPSGSLFLNMGDKYAPNKSLTGLPWRYAIRCIDELGLILRAEIVWAKPNGLPESVTDRVRRSHEQVFHFVKQPRYFSAVDEIREPHVREWGSRPNGGNTYAAMKAPGEKDANLINAMPNPLGKLPGSVWTIPTSPLKVPAELGIDHFAAYPPELVRRIVLGWSPREVCTACGEGRRPVVEKTKHGGWTRATGSTRERSGSANIGESVGQQPHNHVTVDIVGYRCSCWKPGCCCQRFGARHPNCLDCMFDDHATCALTNPAPPTTPGVVLDPFAGTGTTMLVASVFGRVGIGVDLSADYCRLAQWRTTDEKQRAKVAALGKPPKPPKAAPAPAIDLPAPTLFDDEATA